MTTLLRGQRYCRELGSKLEGCKFFGKTKCQNIVEKKHHVPNYLKNHQSSFNLHTRWLLGKCEFSFHLLHVSIHHVYTFTEPQHPPDSPNLSKRYTSFNFGDPQNSSCCYCNRLTSKSATIWGLPESTASLQWRNNGRNEKSL